MNQQKENLKNLKKK